MSCEQPHQALRGAGRGQAHPELDTEGPARAGIWAAPPASRPTWEFGEIRLLVLAAVLVVPKVRGLTGERLGTHQFTALPPDCLSWPGRNES